MSASNYMEEKILDHLFGLATWTAPASIYVSLHTADPGETGASEVSGNSYARSLAGVGSANWTRTSQTVTNDNPVTFTGPTPSAWATVTHFGFWDAATSGNFIGGNALDNSRAPEVDVALSFAAGELVATVT